MNPQPSTINHKPSTFTHQPSTVFEDYARYYDLLYRDKDYAAEAEYVAGLIRKFHPEAKSILELGSGTGIHAALLAEKGFTVHGVERSEEMITIARSNAEASSKLSTINHKPSTINPQPSTIINKPSTLNLQPVFTKGDIRQIRLGRRFDTVIALFHVISYQTTNDDVLAAFKTAREHLNPGGVFIFDVWYGPAVLTERPAIRIKRMADDQTEITRLAEPVLHPNENRVDVNYHVFVRDLESGVVNELRETHVMRYFFKTEIELFAVQNGFRLLNAEEWLSGKAPGEDTWGVCFVMK